VRIHHDGRCGPGSPLPHGVLEDLLGVRLDLAVDGEPDAASGRLGLRLDDVERAASAFPRRPRVYFEEWDEPPITGIRWVAELIRIAGGDDVFPERAAMPLARDRILADADEVVRRAPDIVLGSWCGKKFRPDRVAARPGWSAMPAVRDGELHEIKSPIILQPGPAALFDGLDAMHAIFAKWALSPRRNPD